MPGTKRSSILVDRPGNRRMYQIMFECQPRYRKSTHGGGAGLHSIHATFRRWSRAYVTASQRGWLEQEEIISGCTPSFSSTTTAPFSSVLTVLWWVIRPESCSGIVSKPRQIAYLTENSVCHPSTETLNWILCPAVLSFFSIIGLDWVVACNPNIQFSATYCQLWYISTTVLANEYQLYRHWSSYQIQLHRWVVS